MCSTPGKSRAGARGGVGGRNARPRARVLAVGRHLDARGARRRRRLRGRALAARSACTSRLTEGGRLVVFRAEKKCVFAWFCASLFPPPGCDVAGLNASVPGRRGEGWCCRGARGWATNFSIVRRSPATLAPRRAFSEVRGGLRAKLQGRRTPGSTGRNAAPAAACAALLRPNRAFLEGAACALHLSPGAPLACAQRWDNGETGA